MRTGGNWILERHVCPVEPESKTYLFTERIKLPLFVEISGGTLRDSRYPSGHDLLGVALALSGLVVGTLVGFYNPNTHGRVR